LTPIFYGMFERKRLESVGWSQDAHTVLLDVAPQSVLEVTGRTMQPRPLKLAGEPELRQSVEAIGAQLGLHLDPRCE
jgi:hypothetical protein